MNIRKDILQYNTRQGVAPVLSDFFSNHLNKLIEIIDTIFKTSCLSLLGGILKTMSISFAESTKKLTINNREVIFSPALPLSKNISYSNIWEQMKSSF